MRTSLFLLPANTVAPAGDYHVLRALPDGRIAVHANVDTAIPAQATIVADGSAGAWAWSDLPTLAPSIAAYLLLAHITTSAGVERWIPVADVQGSDTVHATNLAPHVWL